MVPDDFGTISAAILGATDGDSDGIVHIFVREGTYMENLLIQRSDLVLMGENPLTTEIHGSGIPDTVCVENSSGVTIQGFKITGEGIGDGIEFSDVTDSLIKENFVTGNNRGIRLNRSNGNMLRRNLVQGNLRTGIKLGLSDDNTVSACVVRDNASDGIIVDRSMRNVISRNRVRTNARVGIGVVRSTDVLVSECTVVGHGDAGIRVRASSGSVVEENFSSENQNGLRMRETSGSLVTLNALTGNREWGVRRREWVDDDFDASVAGIQDPHGDNDLSGNLLGELREDRSGTRPHELHSFVQEGHQEGRARSALPGLIAS